MNSCKTVKKKYLYQNNKLSVGINHLENKYIINNKVDSYKKLVNFSENKNQAYHSWFQYREGYSGSLVKEIIDSINPGANDYVIDPFCGSGTTILESSLNNVSGFGVDINPMSTFVSEVKNYTYDEKELSILEKKLDQIRISCGTNNFKELSKYFDKKNIEELSSLSDEIEKISILKIRKFFKLIYLSIIEECSNRKRDGNGLRINQTKINSVQSYFISKAKNAIKDIKIQPIDSKVHKKYYTESANNLFNIAKKFEKDTLLKPHAIIFSPPYVNSFDYFESYKMELILGNFVESIKEINTIRQNAVKSFVGTYTDQSSTSLVNLLAEEIIEKIPEKEKITGKKDLRSRKVPNMIRSYFHDMDNILRQCSKCLPTGKKMIINVSQSVYLGVIVPSDLLLAHISETHNFKLEYMDICRFGKTSPQQLKKYPYLKNMVRESILRLEKI